MEIVYKEDQLNEVVKTLWERFQSHHVWAFYAEMGAGKTTLIHHLCAFLQVADHVSSPTFAIVNEYGSAVAGTIFHMDWYRLKDAAEAIDAGVEDILLQRDAYCLIEWPEKATSLLPPDHVEIHISIIDPETRKLEVKQTRLDKKM